jgi:hypothetical protein
MSLHFFCIFPTKFVNCRMYCLNFCLTSADRSLRKCCRVWRNSFRQRRYISQCREYWMIYRGLSFLVIEWFSSSPTPSPPSPVSKLSLFLRIPVCRRSSLLTGEGRRGWGRSQIIRRRESHVLYELFNTLCSGVYSFESRQNLITMVLLSKTVFLS